MTGFRLVAPQVAEVTVHADAIRIGSLFGADPACVAALCQSLSRGGIPAAPSPDVARDLWSKMLYNCTLNPLGALLEVPYGVLGEREVTRRVIEAVVQEVFAVMAAARFASRWATPQAFLRALHEELLPPTARHESSMLQDLRAGRPTEVEFLSGAVARLGTEHGVATPVCAALRDLVCAAGLRARRPPAADAR
jgi:2-dehydropantoate 2-reductase